MSLSFSLTEPGEGRSLNISTNESTHSFHLFYPCQSQSSCSSYFSVFPPGSFKLEIFGSQGGSFVSGHGGLGGYSQGVLSLSEPTHVFLVVGGRSQALDLNGYASSETSFNGGGKSGYNDNQQSGSPGGGSSDFRIEIDDYFHRVIVAGGGGGGGQYNTNSYQGGFGGGETGGDGMKYESGFTGSKSGSQSSGGSGGDYSGHFQSPGIFGVGSDTLYRGSGGGGGWYGGSGGLDGGSGGGGGSGYVNTASSQKPSDYPFNDKYFLEESSTIPNINTGQGHIIVTILSLSSSNFIIISQYPLSLFPLSRFIFLLFIS